MARSDGFGRGALHGALIGAAALAALSLALPVPQGGDDPAMPSGESATVPSAGPGAVSGSGQDTQDRTETSAATGDADNTAPETLVDASGQAATDAEDGGNTQADPDPALQDMSGQAAIPETRMAPPVGSEFARAEDMPPSVPARASAPDASTAAIEVPDEPAVETTPQPVTQTALRPEAVDPAALLQQAGEAQSSPAAPSADPGRPQNIAAPEQVSAPPQDVRPAEESRIAPLGPGAQDATALPVEETPPDPASLTRPDIPDGPEPGDRSAAAQDMSLSQPDAQQDAAIANGAGSEDGASAPASGSGPVTRSAAPALSTPDPTRETVPPPPEAASDAGTEAAPELPDANAAAPAEPATAPELASPAGQPADGAENEAADDDAPPSAGDADTDAQLPSSENGNTSPDLSIPALSITGGP